MQKREWEKKKKIQTLNKLKKKKKKSQPTLGSKIKKSLDFSHFLTDVPQANNSAAYRIQ